MNSSVLVKNDAQLRELLNPTLLAVLDEVAIVESASEFVKSLLDPRHQLIIPEIYEQTKNQLTALHDGLACILDVAEVPEEVRKRQFLNKTGLAMSPEHAMTTIKDVYRVSAFIKALAMAIDDLKAKYGETLHIVYPACGPLAPLLMPLLAYYKNSDKYTGNDLQVTLIDIQEGAVISLKTLFKASGLSSFIREIVFGDAVDYVKEEGDKIHMVVLEAMQHGFSTEGQMAIALHFSPLVETEGLFLPEKISIQAVLTMGKSEFVEQWDSQEYARAVAMNTMKKQERIKLGTVLEVTRKNLQNLEVTPVDEYTSLIHCSSLNIPFFEEGDEPHVLLFCSVVDIYKGEVINEYDSGITHPLPDLSICINFVPKTDLKSEDLLVNSGDTLAFYYRLNGLPGFLVTKAG